MTNDIADFGGKGSKKLLEADSTIIKPPPHKQNKRIPHNKLTVMFNLKSSYV